MNVFVCVLSIFLLECTLWYFKIRKLPNTNAFRRLLRNIPAALKVKSATRTNTRPIIVVVATVVYCCCCCSYENPCGYFRYLNILWPLRKACCVLWVCTVCVLITLNVDYVWLPRVAQPLLAFQNVPTHAHTHVGKQNAHSYIHTANTLTHTHTHTALANIYLRHAHLISVQSRWPSYGRARAPRQNTPTRSIASLYICVCVCISIPVSKLAAASFNFYWDYLALLLLLRCLQVLLLLLRLSRSFCLSALPFRICLRLCLCVCLIVT